jgi:hypothetical protein
MNIYYWITRRRIMKSFITLFVLFFSINLFAIGFIEPYIGAKTGKYKDPNYEPNTLANINNDSMRLNREDGSAKGPTLGLRGGYNGDVMFFGLDFALHIMILDADYNTSDNKAGFVGVTPGFILGFHMPVVPMRLWAGVGGTVYATAHEEVTWQRKWEDAYSGSYYKFGIGFQPLPLLSLNVEFMTERISKIKRTVKNTNTGALISEDEHEITSKPKINTAIFTFSIPIMF